MTNFILKSLFPGLVLIVVAFVMGNHGQLFLGLIGFLSFFVIGITIIVEGWKKYR